MWIRLLAALLLLASPAHADLAGYLARPEPEAGWQKVSESRESDLVHVVLELVSQSWQGKPWRHQLDVFRPVRPQEAGLTLLFVTADAGWFRSLARERRLAAEAGVTVAVLADVPNQPLFGRREDDLVAYTFERFLRTGDPHWPLLLPMTKSAVKAMDAIQALARVEWGAAIERFILSGASKRGWTTWLSAAFDARVAGIVPLVFDNLSFGPQMENQLATWGGYSGELGDYTARGLQALIDTEPGRRLVAQIDPFSHRALLARTRKLIVNGTNDPYWVLGALNLYWDDLEGGKAVLYVPNGDHSIAGEERVLRATSAFVSRTASGRTMPTFRAETFEKAGDVGLRMTWSEPVSEARMWYAFSPSRDFRAARWREAPARPSSDALVAAVERPAAGFVALYGEALFTESGRPFPLSTTVFIIGDGGA